MLPFTLTLSSLAMAQTTQLAPTLPPEAQATDVLTQFIGDANYTKNVFDLSTKAGTTGAPAVQPWSGSYWPLHDGSIANPYDEHGLDFLNFVSRLVLVPVSISEKHYEDRMSKIRSSIDKLDAQTIDQMAPSEKYDLYIGDHDFSLTAEVWQSVMEQLKHVGHIADWEGSCQGWTTAASFSPRPGKAIKVMSLDGKYLIPFYPDDLKALSTLLWANSLIQDYTVFQGQRCGLSDPNYDPSTGHVTDQGCAGVNPGNFHVTVLEMIGARKQHFIVDRSNSTQVWNQPIAGYDLKYFNPSTNAEGALADSVVKTSDYQDPYKNFRTASTVAVVGVHMTLKYVSETLPGHNATDDSSKDNIKNLDLIYDLELDANSQIVGGEWRETSSDRDPNTGEASIPTFPSFIWKFQTATPMAMSIADADLPMTALNTVDQATLIAASKKAAAFRYNDYKVVNGVETFDRAELKPQPLQKVVSTLVNLSL